MRNVSLKVEGDELVIRINLKDKGTPSASGKSTVIATTQGNISVPGTEDKRSRVLCKLGLNLYR